MTQLLRKIKQCVVLSLELREKIQSLETRLAAAELKLGGHHERIREVENRKRGDK